MSLVSSWNEAADEIQKWRSAHSGKVVFTNGCFDLVHAGHLSYLEQARSLGSFLVVGINDDESVTKLKGAGRPILPWQERGKLLAALRCVDLVVPFSQDTPKELIEHLHPDVLVKGGDWKVEDIAGGDFVKNRGGSVHSLGFVPGRSTSEIIAKIRAT